MSMKKITLFFSLCLVSASLFAVEKVDVKASAATVYNSGAEVTYSGTVSLKKGVNEFETSKLNITSATQDIQVKVSGENELWSSALQVVQLDESLELNAYETQLGLEIDSLRKIASNWQTTLLMIGYNRVLGSENNSLTTLQLKQHLDLVRLKSVEMWNALNQLEIEITARVQKQEQSLAKRSREGNYSFALGKIYAEKAGNATLTVKIFTVDAGWKPKYTFFSYPSTNQLVAKLSAEVWQGTGDTWNDVKITFSTGKPAETLKLPQLTTAYVSSGVKTEESTELTYEKPNYYPEVDTLTISAMASRIYDGSTQISTLVNNHPMPTSAIWKTGSFPNVEQYAFVQSNVSDKNGDGIPDYFTSGYGSAVVERSRFKQSMEGAVSYGNALGNGNGTYSLSAPSFAPYGSASRGIVYDSVASGFASNFSIPDINSNQVETSKSIVQEYNIGERLDLRSVALPALVWIRTDTLAVNYQLLVFPNSSRMGFYSAELTNWGAYNLLEGDAEVYENDVRKCSIHFNPFVSADTLRINVGATAEVSASERILKDYDSKQTFGPDYRLLVFEIAVKNMSNQTKQVTAIQSNLLKYDSPDDDLIDMASGSEPVELSGGVMDENQLIRWNLTLKPGETQKRIVSYKVKVANSKQFQVY